MKLIDYRTMVHLVTDYYLSKGTNVFPSRLQTIVYEVKKQYNNIVEYCNSKGVNVDNKALIDELIEQKFKSYNNAA